MSHLSGANSIEFMPKHKEVQQPLAQHFHSSTPATHQNEQQLTFINKQQSESTSVLSDISNTGISQPSVLGGIKNSFEDAPIPPPPAPSRRPIATAFNVAPGLHTQHQGGSLQVVSPSMSVSPASQGDVVTSNVPSSPQTLEQAPPTTFPQAPSSNHESELQNLRQIEALTQQVEMLKAMMMNITASTIHQVSRPELAHPHTSTASSTESPVPASHTAATSALSNANDSDLTQPTESQTSSFNVASQSNNAGVQEPESAAQLSTSNASEQEKIDRMTQLMAEMSVLMNEIKAGAPASTISSQVTSAPSVLTSNRPLSFISDPSDFNRIPATDLCNMHSQERSPPREGQQQFLRPSQVRHQRGRHHPRGEYFDVSAAANCSSPNPYAAGRPSLNQMMTNKDNRYEPHDNQFHLYSGYNSNQQENDMLAMDYVNNNAIRNALDSDAMAHNVTDSFMPNYSHQQRLPHQIRGFMSPQVTPTSDATLPIQQQLQPNTQALCFVEFKRGRVKRFESLGFFAPGKYVIVDGDRGTDCGLVVHTVVSSTSPQGGEPIILRAETLEGVTIDFHRVKSETGRVLRQADEHEIEMLHGEIATMERLALKTCRDRVAQMGVRIDVVDCEFQFDRKKVTFFFDSNDSVDFRELTKELFKTFGARIWLENINSRVKNVVPEGALSHADKLLYADRGLRAPKRTS